MFRLMVLVLVTVGVFAADRVLLFSLDGMGYRALSEDAPTQELSALQRMPVKLPLTTAFPSLTAVSHAAIFTGAYSGKNGVFGNSNPVTPRAEHTLQERITGFRSESLRTEPIWVTTARAGISTVAVQVTQLYPFTRLSAGLDLPHPPVALNGYQTRLLAPHRLLRQADMHAVKPDAFDWQDGPFHFYARRNGNALQLAAAENGPWVTARANALEQAPPRSRPLARHFSAGLAVSTDGLNAVVYFRLFEISANDFLLYRTGIHELAVSPSGVDELLREAGGFIGNSATTLYSHGDFGKTLAAGGNGTAERRYLETAELALRQQSRQLTWLDRRHKARFTIGYFSFPDDFEHQWLGWAKRGLPAIDAYRAWGYAAINRALTPILARFDQRDHVIFVSDHGMAAIENEVHMGVVLRGLPVVPNASCVFVNTVDWKQGTVPLEQRDQVVDQVAAVLARNPIFTRVFRRAELMERFGHGGETMPDLCFDLAPGYAPTEDKTGPEAVKLMHPEGKHGLDPARPELKSIFVARGVGDLKPLRTVEVAPMILKLLLPPTHIIAE